MKDFNGPLDTANEANLVEVFRASCLYDFDGSSAHCVEQPEAIPDGFLLMEDGIHQYRQVEGEDSVLERICSPVVVTGMCRRLDKSGWGRVVEVKDPEGTWHDVVLEARDVAKKSTKVLDVLCDLGMELTAAQKAGQAVKEMLSAWRPSVVIDRVTHLGWTDQTHSAFVLGSGRILGSGKAIVEAVATDVNSAMKPKGEIESWKANVAQPCAGNPLMVLALSHAFSGPLLSLLERDGGGFHLRGASSSGKTTLLRAATSVWGGPSFMQSWRGTDNGLEGIAAACSHSLLVLDELHQVDPKVAGETVYMLANGRGKNRANASGQNQMTKCWTVPVLSSGEISLEEHMASGGRSIMAGQEVRLIDLTADSRAFGAFDYLHGSESGDEFAQRIQRAVHGDYGLAGPAFVERLIKNVEQKDVIKKIYRKVRANCDAKTDTLRGGQVERVLDRFAMAAVAGELATKFGITGWKKGEAVAAARTLFALWLEAREDVNKQEVREALERTREYVQAHGGNFVQLGDHDGSETDGWMDTEWVYIRPACWKRIHGNAKQEEAARLHKAGGYLKTQKGEGMQYKMGREVNGRPRVYAVRASVLHAQGDI